MSGLILAGECERPLCGIERIAKERERQLVEEGHDALYDDSHTGFELSKSAQCYVEAAQKLKMRAAGIDAPPVDIVPQAWPWRGVEWKPSRDVVRNLEKAGAMLAAEFDRLRRLPEFDRMRGHPEGVGREGALLQLQIKATRQNVVTVAVQIDAEMAAGGAFGALLLNTPFRSGEPIMTPCVRWTAALPGERDFLEDWEGRKLFFYEDYPPIQMPASPIITPGPRGHRGRLNIG